MLYLIRCILHNAKKFYLKDSYSYLMPLIIRRRKKSELIMFQSASICIIKMIRNNSCAIITNYINLITRFIHRIIIHDPKILLLKFLFLFMLQNEESGERKLVSKIESTPRLRFETRVLVFYKRAIKGLERERKRKDNDRGTNNRSNISLRLFFVIMKRLWIEVTYVSRRERAKQSRGLGSPTTEWCKHVRAFGTFSG